MCYRKSSYKITFLKKLNLNIALKNVEAGQGKKSVIKKINLGSKQGLWVSHFLQVSVQ
jgi:hypothetical protein